MGDFSLHITGTAVNGAELRLVGEVSPVLAGGDKWTNVSRSSSGGICSDASCDSPVCGGTFQK